MKKSIVLYTFLVIAFSVKATEQMPDILFYNGQELSLHTGWGHPSPLQTYYSQNNIKYPFTMWHTANYRGHIAVWVIENGKFYIKEVQTEKKKYKPIHFKIKSQSDSLSNNTEVFADWFSGVLECSGKKDYYYFFVKNGIIKDVQIINEEDFSKIRKISEKETSNIELMNKYKMLLLNQNYISYYFRLHANDTITFDNKGGYLNSQSGLSPLLAYYSNDHTKWPFNWENVEKSGAPNCSWTIENNKIFLTSIRLYSGTGFYEIDKDSISLNEIFKNEIISNRVFGDWLNGIYVVKHGKEVENEFGYKEFEPSEYTFLRINMGIVTEKYVVPKDFNFQNIPKDTNPGLKKIITELYKENN